MIDRVQAKKNLALQASGQRFGPRELEGYPEIVEKIIDLFVVKGWTAKRVAAHFDDPRITPRTVYGVAQRYRKCHAKVLKKVEKIQDKYLPARPVKTTPAAVQGPYVMSPVETLELKTIDPSLVPDNVDEIDVVRMRKRNREFLLRQAEQAALLSQKIMYRAQTSVDREEDPHAVEAQIRSWQRTIEGFKKLAGLEDDNPKPKLNLHGHIHYGMKNPFREKRL